MLKPSIIAGVSIKEFDELTLKELLLILEAYKDKKEYEAKRDAVMSYNIASMTAQFVSLNFNGKSIPKIEKVFSDTFKDTCGLSEEEYNKRLARFQEEQLVAKFNRINAKRKEGNK